MVAASNASTLSPRGFLLLGAMRACLHCGAEYQPTLRQRSQCCSEACTAERRRLRGLARYAAARSAGIPWGPRTRVSLVRESESQLEYSCGRCQRPFFVSKVKALYCSVDCRRAAARYRQTGVALVERTDPQRCTGCGHEKPLAEFPVAKSSGLVKRRCKRCCSGPDPVARRRQHLLSRFGLTLEAWTSMYFAQLGRCPICDIELPSLPEMGATASRKRKRNWATDHDHKTGKVRGILCCSCNLALGSLRDSPAIARSAAAYLERHQVTEEAANG